jgi:hypothetical protein
MLSLIDLTQLSAKLEGVFGMIEPTMDYSDFTAENFTFAFITKEGCGLVEYILSPMFRSIISILDVVSAGEIRDFICDNPYSNKVSI